MSKLEFSMKLESSVEELMEVIMDFEKWPTFLPRQLKSVKILKKTENETTIEEILVFKTLVKNEIKQTSIYKKISDNSIHSQIISGHAKGTETYRGNYWYLVDLSEDSKPLPEQNKGLGYLIIGIIGMYSWLLVWQSLYNRFHRMWYL